MAYGTLEINGRRRGTCGRNPVLLGIRFSLNMEMSRLTRDRTTTAEPVSRDQKVIRRERGQGIL